MKSANKGVETNRRPALPFEPRREFESIFCPPPFLSAAVAHLHRSAAMTRFPRGILFIVSLVFCSLCLTSCTKHYTGIPIAQLRQMAPFKAEVEKITVEDFSNMDAEIGMVAIVWLRTMDGRRVSIGGPKAAPEMVGFARSLMVGQQYVFPEVFLDYEKSNLTEK